MTSATSFSVLDLAFRLVVLMLSLVMMAFIIAIGSRAALAASLRAETLLTGDVLTVGDVFENAGRNADYVLGPAPQPGHDMVLNTSTLVRIAMALDLPWQPESSTDHIIIRRAATVIPGDMVHDAIAAQLADKVPNKDFKLDIGSKNLDMTLPHDQPATLDVSNVSFNPRTDRFEATVFAPSKDKPLKQVTVTGTVRSMAMVPVLKSNLRNGDIIGDSDIDYVEMFTTDIPAGAFTNTKDLIGMTPRRIAVAGKPLRTLDMQSPLLVSRGESITIRFTEGALNLTAMGKSMQNGARGDVIRVVNSASNRPIDGTVSGFREITVKQ